MQSHFKAEKATAAIGYLVRATRADLYAVMKMLYLADKEHLRLYGRTIAGDQYLAMSKGPVPDRAYNLCKYVRGQREHFDAMPEAREWLRLNGNNFELLREPDLEELSRTDISALDHAAAIYQDGGWRAVFTASHDEAWEAAWQEAEARSKGCGGMELEAVASTLPNGAALIEFLADPHPGDASETPDARH